MKRTPLKSAFIPLALIMGFFLYAIPTYALVQNNYYADSTEQQTTLGGSIFFTLECDYGIVIDSLPQVYLRTISGTLANVDVKLASTTIATYTGVTASNSYFQNIDFNDYVCTGLPVSLEFDITNSANLQIRTQLPASAPFYPNAFIDISLNGSSYGEKLNGMVLFTYPQLTPPSGSEIDMATTTKVIEVFSTQFLFYSLIMIVIASITLIFTIRKR